MVNGELMEPTFTKKMVTKWIAISLNSRKKDTLQFLAMYIPKHIEIPVKILLDHKLSIKIYRQMDPKTLQIKNRTTGYILPIFIPDNEWECFAEQVKLLYSI